MIVFKKIFKQRSKIVVKMVDLSLNYVTDFTCTYQRIQDPDESELLYKIQLLQAFGLDEFDETIINNTTEQLYEKYKDNKYIVGIISADIMEINKIFLDKATQFRIYFGYETFHMFHNLLCTIIKNVSTNDINYNKLINK